MGLPKVGWDNLGRALGVKLEASSFEAANPKWNIQSQSRVTFWISRLGWNILAGVNNMLDFDDGGVTRTAEIEPDNYVTGEDLAAVIVIALNLATVTNTWSGSYDQATNKFTFSHDAVGTGGLLFASGPNAGSDPAKDLGYTETDHTGGASYVSDNAVYHSREWLLWDLQTSEDVDIVSAFDFLELAAGGEVRIEGNATDDFSSPTFSQVLQAGSYFATDVFATQTFRYWRLVVDDPQNPEGYSRLSYVHFGPELEIGSNFLFGYTRGRNELTDVSMNYRGNTFVDVNSSLHFWDTEWVVEDADRTALEEALDTLKVGVKFVFLFDPDTDETDQELVYIENSVRFRQATIGETGVFPGLWRFDLTLNREHGEGFV